MKTGFRLVLINVLVIFVLFAVVELAYSTYVYLTANQSARVWAAEDSGRTIRYDPVKGYTLTRTPSRFTNIAHGVLNYVGTIQGNNQGFPDRDDFFYGRKSPDQRRYAVLGDSFTAGNFLSHNWPDRAEDILSAQSLDVDLLNLSGDGWGLGNWTSIVDGMLGVEPYELDGLIFAVWTWDLARKFTYSDHRGQQRRAARYASGWNPDTHPQSEEEALAALDGTGPASSSIISTEEFDALLRGETAIEAKWQFALTEMVKSVLQPTVQTLRKSWQGEAWDQRFGCNGETDPDKLELFETIKNFASERDLTIDVVYIWSREGLIDGNPVTDLCRMENARDFADRIGARFINGGDVFAGIQRDQLKQLWLPNDLHWGQGASDLFASFMAGILAENAR